MPTLIFGHSEALARWAAHRIPHVAEGAFGPCQAIGVASSDDADAQLYAVCVFSDWQPQARTLQVSIAAVSPKWCTKGTVRALFHYAFCQAGAYKLWSAMPANNERAIRLNSGLGFKHDATIRHQFGPRRHAVVQSMTWDEYRKSRWFVGEQRRAA